MKMKREPKMQEYRSAKISNDTFEFLMDYLAKYRKILQHQDYLFVNIMGENIGKPLRVDSVYDMLDRMEKKTELKSHPHVTSLFCKYAKAGRMGTGNDQSGIGGINIWIRL